MNWCEPDELYAWRLRQVKRVLRRGPTDPWLALDDIEAIINLTDDQVASHIEDGVNFTLDERHYGSKPTHREWKIAADQAVLDAGWSDVTGLGTRLRAFGRDCVTHGDMTPGAQRMLNRIAGEIERA